MPEEIFQKLTQVVFDRDFENAEALAKQVMKPGSNAHACIREGVIKGIQRVSSLFACGEYLLPEFINWADALEDSLMVLETALTGDHKREVIASAVLSRMEGDQHEMAKSFIGRCLMIRILRIFKNFHLYNGYQSQVSCLRIGDYINRNPGQHPNTNPLADCVASTLRKMKNTR